MPRVSILLTCYNHRSCIEEAVASIRAQTFTDFEVLALDDGSTDGTREWLAEQPDLNCFFHEKNLGTYANLNFGIEHSTGEFIAIFNDDDVWAPDKLARQMESMDAEPDAGLVHTGGWFIDASGNRIEGEPLGFPWPKTTGENDFAELVEFNKVITSSALVRRKVFAELGGFSSDFYGCGDWQMWIRLSEKWKVIHIDEPLTFYRVHAGNACLDTEKMDRDSWMIREWFAKEKIPQLASRISSDPRLHQAAAHNWACLGTERMWFGQPGGAREAYRASAKMNPGRWQTWLRMLLTYLPRKVFRRLN